MPAPRQEQLIALLLSIWAGLFTWSIVGIGAGRPADAALRGVDRATLALLWHMATAIASVAVYLAGRSYQPGSAVRRLSRIPLALTVATAIAAAAFTYFGRLGATQG